MRRGMKRESGACRLDRAAQSLDCPRNGKRGGAHPATVRRSRSREGVHPAEINPPLASPETGLGSSSSTIAASGTTPERVPCASRHLAAAVARRLCRRPLCPRTKTRSWSPRTRFPEDARRLPASITVITAEDIAEQRRAHAARAAAGAGRHHDEGFLRQQRRRAPRSTCAASASPAAQNTLILLDGRRITDIDLTSVQWSAIPLAGDRAHRDPARHRRGALRRRRLGRRDQHRHALAAQAGRARSRRAAASATFNTREGQLYGSYATRQLRHQRLGATATPPTATAPTTATSSRTTPPTCAGRSARRTLDLRVGHRPPGPAPARRAARPALDRPRRIRRPTRAARRRRSTTRAATASAPALTLRPALRRRRASRSAWTGATRTSARISTRAASRSTAPTSST